ncbi:MAG: hypothetical protein LBM95_08355 [Lactobacillales bacterium]|jgi:DNA repair exonuclease SbcCD ATPase subunit|nr:hypothetical protein [Lactobacillales bacterium]
MFGLGKKKDEFEDSFGSYDEYESDYDKDFLDFGKGVKDEKFLDFSDEPKFNTFESESYDKRTKEIPNNVVDLDVGNKTLQYYKEDNVNQTRKIEELNRKLSSIEQQLSMSELDKQDAVNKLNQIQDELNRTNGSGVEIEELRASLEDTTTEVHQVRQENHNLMNELDRVRESYDQLLRVEDSLNDKEIELEEVTNEKEQLSAKLLRTENELVELKEQFISIEELEETRNTIADTLIESKRMGKSIEDKAKAESERIISEANEQSENMKKELHYKAGKIIAKAEADSEQMIYRAKQEAEKSASEVKRSFEKEAMKAQIETKNAREEYIKLRKEIELMRDQLLVQYPATIRQCRTEMDGMFEELLREAEKTVSNTPR